MVRIIVVNFTKCVDNKSGSYEYIIEIDIWILLNL